MLSERGSLKRQKERVCVREKRERAWKRVGGNTEGGPPLTKDGVKMEGEKYGKGEPPRPTLDSLFLFLSRFLLGVPVGIRLPKRVGRFRNFAGGIPRAMRQLFKTISISMPKRDARCLMPRLTNGNILKASVQFRSREKKWIDF